MSLSAWWDAGKARFQSKIRVFLRQKASSFRKHIASLENTLFHLDRCARNGEDVALMIVDAKADLEQAHRQQSCGARIRSNTQWAEEGEASKDHFFRLEHKHGQQCLFSAIKNLGGIVVRSFSEIARAWVGFYGLLFMSQKLNVAQQDFFLSQLSMKLSDGQLQVCKGELTLKECKHALDSMASGKSPSLDGLPAKFFQRFWSLMRADYVEVLNYCYVVEKLSPTQRSGVITLLHKKGDRLEMKNWQPITLLYVDYKIATKAIADASL